MKEQWRGCSVGVGVVVAAPNQTPAYRYE